MDAATQHVRDFLGAMEQVRAELDQIVRDLYKRPEVKLATTFSPAPYLSCDFGVSADLRDGAVVDLWVDLDSTEEGWSVHPKVYQHDPSEDGSRIERDLGVRVVGDAAALPVELARALRELRASIDGGALSARAGRPA